jgi:hypothetical protein
MNRLGRLLALPWLLMALTVQSLAPAEAAVMRPDMTAMGICSAAGLSGGPHRNSPPASHPHDCCAFACALAGLGAAPPRAAAFTPARLDVALDLSLPPYRAPPHPSPAGPPRARGPPVRS